MGTNRRAWTAKEDMILRDFVETHGEAQWASLPVRAGLKRRGKSCRLRWFNYLRPNIKRGNISADEDDLIIRLHRLLGNRWSLIAKRLPGRTDNEIKNYWNTHLRKKLEKDGSAHKLIPKPIESYWNAHNNNVPTNVDDHKTYKATADGSHATREIMSTPSANRVSQSTPVLCPGKTNRKCLHSELDSDLVDKSAADEVHEPKSLYETQLGETYFEQEWQSSFMPLASTTDFPFLYQDFAQPDLLLAGKTNSTQNIIYSPDCGLPFFTADSSLDLLLQKLCTDNL